MRTYFRAFEDPKSLKFKGHKEARIYNITLFVTHVLMFIMVQLLYIPFRMRCMYNKMLVEIAIFLHLW